MFFDFHQLDSTSIYFGNISLWKTCPDNIEFNKKKLSNFRRKGVGPNCLAIRRPFAPQTKPTDQSRPEKQVFLTEIPAIRYETSDFCIPKNITKMFFLSLEGREIFIPT